MAKALEHGIVLSQSSRVGTQREYEAVTVLKPDTPKPEILSLITRLQAMFTERAGKLLKVDSWGMRVLAYPVKKSRKGIYVHWRFIGGSDIVKEFERLLGLSQQVIRFYTVRVDEDIDPEAKPSEITEELLDAASEPGPDPDELRRQAEEEAARLAAIEAEKAAAEAAEREAARAAEAAARASEEADAGDAAEPPSGEGAGE
ncbi:MAG: 30S ribosomal protein S6 [Myxococcota bacterium]